MQLTRLTIENVRAIERFDVDLTDSAGRPRRRVVLLGVNGSGKTTILDAVAHAFQVLGADRRGELGAKLLGAEDVRSAPVGVFERYVERGLVRIVASLTDSERRSAPAGFPAAPEPTRGVLSFPIGGDADWILGEPGAPSTGFDVSARAAILGARPPCVLLPATRGALEQGADVRIGDVLGFDPRDGCLSKRQERFAPLAARLALAFMAPKQADSGGAVARMWNVLAKYVPELPKPLDVRGLELWFKTPDGRAVPLAALSDGERAVLLLFAEVALRAPHHGVIMVDEVEQHLHPRWQLAVVEGLPALVPTAQILFTTQAPYVAACAPDDAVKVGDWDRHGE